MMEVKITIVGKKGASWGWLGKSIARDYVEDTGRAAAVIHGFRVHVFDRVDGMAQQSVYYDCNVVRGDVPPRVREKLGMLIRVGTREEEK